MTNLLKARQVAEYLHVPCREFLDMVEAGQGPVCILLPSGRRRWRLADVDAWVACHAVSVSAAAAATAAAPAPAPPEPAPVPLPVPPVNDCTGTNAQNQGGRPSGTGDGTGETAENNSDNFASESADATGAIADKLSQAQIEVLSVLPMHGTWLTTPAAARRISADISPTSGDFRRKIRQLKEARLIDSTNQGLRLTELGKSVRLHLENEPP
ncbi:helix-turn-helix transcriptional regulator [Tuwongella immobilis]|uniref:Helix-turn-helix domain-containing protein n=1 Tax=Tuwongella immobilis TaxID=692036 RepID=A0A6C2YKN6_9BACT|nr:helix-turn-helix domain-containing protein [Tuwongella immobilis]VIP02140.1 unnamed protein product [Tuwongella immobilis]VTS00507.1 unnamed protein product [Tuwongella immobilis]